MTLNSSAFRSAAFGLCALAAGLCASPALAAPAAVAPAVVVSIKPLGSLVAMVTGDVTTPYVLVQGNSSPHDYALKPTDAAALERAHIVVWAGPELEVFLQKPLETLAPYAAVLTLTDIEGLTLLDTREGGMFDKDEHVDAHQQHAPGDEQIDARHTYDPHIWLDPENAIVMVGAIAQAFEEIDPDNAATYQANAARAVDDLRALNAQIKAEFSALETKPFVVFHDAYHYFEHRFGVEAAGSITVNLETAPGAQRISEIHDRLASFGAACVFAEPQFTPKVLDLIAEGINVKIGVLDPLGAELEEGPDLYPQLLRNMAKSLQDCFSN